jgi:diketogulonate reductase-like aldo/keto reductase
MPYDPSAPLATQITTSVTSSLTNLRHADDSSSKATYLDCLLLHSPLPTIDQTLHAWALLETYVPHQIHTLGISNVTLPILQTIYRTSTIKPSVVQNRFYPQTRYDVELRAFCREHGIAYQSFWTLTGNPALHKARVVEELAKEVGVGKEVALYALVGALGIEVLNGTTDGRHMREDLEGVERARVWKEGNGEAWDGVMREFRGIVGDG